MNLARSLLSAPGMRRTHLDLLIDQLIAEIIRFSDVCEGDVICTAGPPLYRRIDCDGRALAYIRARPRKQCVRVDVSGLWRAPLEGSLVEPVAAGASSLLVRSTADIAEVVRYLKETIEVTRRLHLARTG